MGDASFPAELVVVVENAKFLLAGINTKLVSGTLVVPVVVPVVLVGTASSCLHEPIKAARQNKPIPILPVQR